MVMSIIFLLFSGISLISALCLGRGAQLSASVLQGAQAGFQLVLTIAGSLCLWSGVGRLMEKVGISAMLSRLLAPLLGRIFPSYKRNPQAADGISGNVCANLLGLGNAATPLGIQAALALRNPQTPTIATDELCRLVVLNTASIQLIPANVAAIRAGLGSPSPFGILPHVWVASICSAGMGLMAAWLLGRIWKFD